MVGEGEGATCPLALRRFKVYAVNNKIQTCLISKKTDAHLYLTTNPSCNKECC